MSRPTSRVDRLTTRMRTLVQEGVFAGGSLPSEPDLSRQFHVSRATVRQALAALASDGLIVRRPGVGTFVNEHVLNIGTRLEEVWDFAEMIRLSGHEPGVHHVALRLASAGSDVADHLGLPAGQEVLSTANVFLAGECPVIYCIDFIPAHLVTSAYNPEELHGPVYSFLRRRCAQQVDYNLTRILPTVADAEMAALLACPAGTPLHLFQETGFNRRSEPVIYSLEYYLPAYFSFSVVRKMTTQGVEDD